jgi:hypothetical protein
VKVTITVGRAAGQWTVTVRTGSGIVARRSAEAHVDDEGRWWPSAALPDLAARIGDRRATVGEVLAYGRLLFDFLLGDAAWQQVRAHAGGDDVLEFRLSWPADDGALHRMVWELMHDGAGYLALDDATPVVVLREVADAPPGRFDRPAICTIPRVLFAVGSRLTDPRVRAGAEFMGVLRALQRGGGSIRQRVLTEASLDRIGASCASFGPQIVHLIGHGRWDEQTGQAVLEMRSDENPATTVEVTGAELLGALKCGPSLPVAAVVSACQSGVSFSEGGAPLAATLVAGGVPVVIAMAGDVADTACRVFTRSVAASVSEGLALAWAVREGRRAAFRRGLADLNPLDWALPALFVSPDLPERFALVDTAGSRLVRDRVRQLGLDWTPVFYGRDEFFEDLDRLLDPAEALAVLVARSDVAAAYGGTRLLRELAGAALRAGHLPCMVGPFPVGKAPTSVRGLTIKIIEQVVRLRKALGVAGNWRGETLPVLAADAGVPDDLAPAALLARLARHDGPDVPFALVADQMRNDLFALAADALPGGAPLLLLDDVHLYDHALDALVEEGVLGPAGFGDGGRILPAVLFGKVTVANGRRITEASDAHRGAGWWSCRSMRLFRDLAADQSSDEDVLAYQWWFLNPSPTVAGLEKVLAPRRVADNDWAEVARLVMEESEDVYDPVRLCRIAKYALRKEWFSPSDDDEILRAYGIIS